MGEYYANGYGGRRQPYTAAEMFSNAAVRGDSQVSQHLVFSNAAIRGDSHVSQHSNFPPFLNAPVIFFSCNEH